MPRPVPAPAPDACDRGCGGFLDLIGAFDDCTGCDLAEGPHEHVWCTACKWLVRPRAATPIKTAEE